MFIDNILIYLKSKEEHEVHLKVVLELLKKEELFAKLSKCEIRLQEVYFFGHVVNNSGFHVDPSTIDVSFQTSRRLYRIWRHYLYGTKSVIYTNHKNLQHIFDQKKLNMRKRSWVLNFLVTTIVRFATIRKRRTSCIPELRVQGSKQARQKRLHGLDQKMECKEDGSCTLWYTMGSIGRMYYGLNLDVARYIKEDIAKHVSKCWTGLKVKDENIKDHQWVIVDSLTKKSRLIGPELVQETTDKVVLIKEKLIAVRDRLKSYVSNRIKPLALRISPVAYKLSLPEELSEVHDMFHVSNLKKCLADANLHVPLEEIKIEKNPSFY
ncbi:putative reverse transcriptase domain-containing protein [Tanacetum coccineum]